jgi:hypothetical protein
MPAGIGWLYAVLPPSAPLARAGTILMVATALAALVGWHARIAAAMWAAVGVWILGVPQLYGKVDHSHHFIWFAALLAASPCADVLSIDALKRRCSGAGPAVRYGFPVRVWWLLIGLIYFFAGFWKLAAQGLGWASPANMRPLLHLQWIAAEHFVPGARIDRWPLAMVAMGVGTLVFELGFVFGVFTRWRPWAVAAGLTFHVGTFLFLGISFTTLMAAYVAFVPWSATLATKQRAQAATKPSARRPDRVTVAVATTLVCGVLLAGASQTVSGWPFANYPTFASRFGDTQPVVELEANLAGGGSLPVALTEVLPPLPASKTLGVQKRLLELPEVDQARVLRSLHIERALGADVRTITAYLAVYSTSPGHRRLISRDRLTRIDLESPLPD